MIEKEENTIIELCKEFAKKADTLETKGFSNADYKENGFVNDFNKLFNPDYALELRYES